MGDEGLEHVEFKLRLNIQVEVSSRQLGMSLKLSSEIWPEDKKKRIISMCREKLVPRD